MHIQLPDSLQEQLRRLAERDGISVDQFIATAVAEKMASLLTESYLNDRAKRGERARFEAALQRVPDAAPEEHDRLPSK